jgi:hypothetical protein
MNWRFQNTEILEISDLPENSYGFVYIITHVPSNKSYIGKKILVYTKKAKLTKKDLLLYEGKIGRKPTFKLTQKESNWKTYWGSNIELLELIKNEPIEDFTRDIIITSPSKKLLTYYEIKYMMVYEVLEKDSFFNSNISGKFYSDDFKL